MVRMIVAVLIAASCNRSPTPVTPALDDGVSPAFGPADAPVTLVAFSDFDCSECARGSMIAATARNLHAGKVRFVFRQFPLPAHPHARLAAEASLAAQSQGKFWQYHDVLFGNGQALERTDLERYAAAAGLDVRAFAAALDDHRHAARVETDLELGRRMGVGRVPALFANGKRVSFPFDVDSLAAAITDAASR